MLWKRREPMLFFLAPPLLRLVGKNLGFSQAARRVSNHKDKKPAQRKPSGTNKGGAAAAAAATAAPRKSSSPAAAPRESTSIGAIGAAVVGADGSVQDVEQRVADVFVAFASSVAKVTEPQRGRNERTELVGAAVYTRPYL